MQPQNPDYQTVIQQVFSASPFMQELGARLLADGLSWCECELPLAILWSLLFFFRLTLFSHFFTSGGLLCR